MSGLVLQLIVGIKDPVRKEVPQAVKDCQSAGVIVRMVTGDNILTATHIAEECGIKTPDGIAMEGPAFRLLSNAQLDPMLRGKKQLEVIARCSPLDKQRLVGRLQVRVAAAALSAADARARVRRSWAKLSPRQATVVPRVRVVVCRVCVCAWP